MSVINKMLRDLDQRNAGEQVKGQGVQSVASVPARPDAGKTTGASPRWVLMLVFVIVVAAAVWIAYGAQGSLWNSPPTSPAAQVAPMATAPAIELPASSVALVVPKSAPETTAVPEVSPPVVAETALVQDKSAFRLERSMRQAPAASEPTVAAPVVKTAPPPAAQPGGKPLVPQVPPASQEAQRQAAARDTIASAQALWNSGAKEPAIALLQDVLASGERSLPASSTSLGSGLLALVRELVRMQLADARPGAAWDLLVRLEPQIRNEAELWAVRGNAAQRIARHEDSVLAYTAALQIRPGEQRWLLGAAVSLAALGKNDAAAGMADKALAVGPISKEVQSYLRQMGVPLKD